MLLLVCAAAVLALAACGEPAPQVVQPTPAAQPPALPADEAPPESLTSMKGYELYSWQQGDNWYFAVVTGTNRIQTLADITASDAPVQGVDALKNQLAQLPDNTWLYWSAQWVPETAMPSEEVVNDVAATCEQLDIRLKVE
jgi:hypothetical protein